MCKRFRERIPAVALNTIDISVRGKWHTVPAVNIDGKYIIIKGRWIKVAVVSSEEWLETEIEDPGACVRRLKEQQAPELRAHIFTFTQKPPSKVPRYAYP